MGAEAAAARPGGRGLESRSGPPHRQCPLGRGWVGRETPGRRPLGTASGIQRGRLHRCPAFQARLIKVQIPTGRSELGLRLCISNQLPGPYLFHTWNLGGPGAPEVSPASGCSWFLGPGRNLPSPVGSAFAAPEQLLTFNPPPPPFLLSSLPPKHSPLLAPGKTQRGLSALEAY